MLQRAVGTIGVTDAAGRRVDSGVAGGSDHQVRRLRAGDRVAVADASRVAFVLDDGTSVRLAAGTIAVFTARDRIELERGAVYVDANPAQRAGALVVNTTVGERAPRRHAIRAAAAAGQPGGSCS